MAYNEIAERKALVALKQQAYEKTVTILMQTYGDDIFRFCQSMLNNNADAQDILQIVFIQAHKGLEKFHGDSNFRTWLYSITRNRCLDHLKKNRRLGKRIDFVDEIPEPANQSSADRKDQQDPFISEVLRRCLGELSTSVRTAILLRFQSEHSYEEAASIVHEKAGTLQARVARALPVLRRCVEGHGVAL